MHAVRDYDFAFRHEGVKITQQKAAPYKGKTFFVRITSKKPFERYDYSFYVRHPATKKQLCNLVDSIGDVHTQLTGYHYDILNCVRAVRQKQTRDVNEDDDIEEVKEIIEDLDFC